MTMVHVAQVASFGVLFLTSLGHSDLGQLTWHEPQRQENCSCALKLHSMCHSYTVFLRNKGDS